MQNVTAELDHEPGALARFGETLGAARVSLEGGGVFTVDGRAIANFLVADGDAAKRALEAAGIRVLAVREVVMLRLAQGIPGQLGMVCRRMAEAGVNIDVQYSDHDNQLVLVVDDAEKGAAVAAQWMRGLG